MYDVTVLGSFVADVAFRMKRMPQWGETLMGEAFKLGPGGKGSNQAVAAVRAGAKTAFVSKVGKDAFGQLARDLYANEGIDAQFVFSTQEATGSAAILIDEARGENAIIVVPGACYTVTEDEVDQAEAVIASSKVLMVQLELPVSIVEQGLRLAKKHGVTTILNPAPAQPLTKELLSLVDFLVPNETEAALLASMSTCNSLEEAERAAETLLAYGVANVVMTRGEQGAIARGKAGVFQVPAISAGAVRDTTGAGDAFCGGFAAALGAGRPIEEALTFASAVAGLSVTRDGTALAMPYYAEVVSLLNA